MVHWLEREIAEWSASPRADVLHTNEYLLNREREKETEREKIKRERETKTERKRENRVRERKH